MARYKAIPSRKQEFDAFWDEIYNIMGISDTQKTELTRQSNEFRQNNERLLDSFNEMVAEELKPGGCLEDYKKDKLGTLNIQAHMINNLEE